MSRLAGPASEAEGLAEMSLSVTPASALPPLQGEASAAHLAVSTLSRLKDCALLQSLLSCPFDH